MKVTHLITGLGKGGAETMMYQVLQHKTDPAIEYCVISLGASSFYEDKIRTLGVKLDIISIKKHPLTVLYRIRKLLSDTDVLCCWMYHALFIGYLAGKMAHIQRIVWNVRHSDLSPELNSKLTLLINSWCAKKSKSVSVVAYNGEKARIAHEAIGYDRNKGNVIINGVDTKIFHYDSAAAEKIRTELNISATKRIILSVARYHIIKDIPTFIHAFSKIHAACSDVVAVMCGQGVEDSNAELVALLENNNLVCGVDVHLLGMRHDIPELMSACDLYVLHSASEAFPNTLVQAMACECLCVSTDVGDAKKILENSIYIAEPHNVNSLSEKMLNLLALPQEEAKQLRQANRERVLKNYDIQAVVRAYEKLYVE